MTYIVYNKDDEEALIRGMEQNTTEKEQRTTNSGFVQVGLDIKTLQREALL